MIWGVLLKLIFPFLVAFISFQFVFLFALIWSVFTQSKAAEFLTLGFFVPLISSYFSLFFVHQLPSTPSIKYAIKLMRSKTEGGLLRKLAIIGASFEVIFLLAMIYSMFFKTYYN